MKVGLVGTARSGKTTLFNSLTALHRANAHAHLGAIKVPDARLEALAARYLVRRMTPAEIVFVDLPGSRVAGMGDEARKTLADVDALCLVLRGFGKADTLPDPLHQLRDFDSELIAADLASVESRIDHMRKTHGGRSGGEFHELEMLRAHLVADRPLRVLSLSDAERQVLAPFGLLSQKPMLIVLNVDEAAINQPVSTAIEAEQTVRGTEALALCASLEAEILELEPVEQPAFLKSLGLSGSVRDRFIRATYHLLDLLTFFTVGEDEVRAFTLHRGEKAPRAAGRIDPELERRFSRLEVTHYDELMAVRDKGRSHLEGKEYVVHDGDLLRVRTDH